MQNAKEFKTFVELDKTRSNFPKLADFAIIKVGFPHSRYY